jgi:hypothetical protein
MNLLGVGTSPQDTSARVALVACRTAIRPHEYVDVSAVLHCTTVYALTAVRLME